MLFLREQGNNGKSFIYICFGELNQQLVSIQLRKIILTLLDFAPTNPAMLYFLHRADQSAKNTPILTDKIAAKILVSIFALDAI